MRRWSALFVVAALTTLLPGRPGALAQQLAGNFSGSGFARLPDVVPVGGPVSPGIEPQADPGAELLGPANGAGPSTSASPAPWAVEEPARGWTNWRNWFGGGSGGYGGGSPGYGGAPPGSGGGAAGYGSGSRPRDYLTSCLPADCDECPRHGYYAFVGYDSWRGVSDGSWQNNGLHTGFNLGTSLGPISDWTGVGIQGGASFAVYDFLGTDYRLDHNNVSETQGFVTYGLFRKATANCPVSAGIVQDWMINYNFGVLGQNPTLGQLRMQVGYAFNAFNEVGIWGTRRDFDDYRVIPTLGDRSFRPINQLNAYWHYKWGEFGPDTWISVGVPERDRLGAPGSLGDYLANARFNAPLGNQISVYAQVAYMHASAAPGPIGSTEDAWMFAVGLAIYPAGNARQRTIAGQCYMPLMPVANNGLFFVDTNRTY